MRTGKVYLVGAGPGHPGLIPVRGYQLLHGAQVIVYVRLVNPVLLEQVPPSAIRIFVGKQAGRHCIAQEEINRTLIDHAQLGNEVVRLKGGDPFVFGRGGEEQAALEAEGIAVDVVPGITAALGCAASIGLPLTQRGQNTAFTLLTATSESGLADQDWASLARPGRISCTWCPCWSSPAITRAASTAWWWWTCPRRCRSRGSGRAAWRRGESAASSVPRPRAPRDSKPRTT